VFTIPRWDDHANKRKKKYNIDEKQIAEAWVYGELKKTRDDCWLLISKKITLVLSPEGDFIITMYPNKYHDRHAGERIAQAMSIGATRFEEES
jgi:hypothetical protein